MFHNTFLSVTRGRRAGDQREECMRQYETTFIIDGQLDGQHREGVIEKYENLLDRLGATRNQTVRWGLRTLAYEIAKRTRGYYIIIYFDADPAIIRSFHHEMDISENILRYMSLKFDGPHPDYIRDVGRSEDVLAIEPEPIVDPDAAVDADADAADEVPAADETVEEVVDVATDEAVEDAAEEVVEKAADPVAETEVVTDDAAADETPVDAEEAAPAVEEVEADAASEVVDESDESEGSDKE
jgi:small subunit ribosomal protein S6